jgi:hypothetical protein
MKRSIAIGGSIAQKPGRGRRSRFGFGGLGDPFLADIVEAG